MDIKDGLKTLAELSEIVTATLAASTALYFWRRQAIKMRMLLDCLRRDASPGQGHRSLLHVQMNTGMTEAEILEASFTSRFIVRHQVRNNESGQTTEIRYAFDPDGRQPSEFSIWSDRIPVPFWPVIIVFILLAILVVLHFLT